MVVYPLERTYLLWADFRGLGLDPGGLERLLTGRQPYFSQGMAFAGGAGFERVNLACPRRCPEAAMERLDRVAGELELPR